MHPRRGHPAAELRHQWGDARHLADDDHRGTGPDPEDVTTFAVGLEGFLGEILQFRLPPARFAVGHGGTVASAVVAGPMRSLDPRLPVLVGLGAADDVGVRGRPHDRRGGRGSGRRRRARTPGPHRLHRRAAGHLVAHRPGAHGGPARRLTPGAHAPVRDRRLPAGGRSTTRWRPWRPDAPTRSSSPGPRRGRGRATAASTIDEEDAAARRGADQAAGLRGPGGDRGRHGLAARAAVRAH